MQKKLTYLINVLLMIVILAVTFFALLQGEDLQEVFGAIRKADKSFLLCALCCALLFLVLQGISMDIILKSLGMPVRLRQNIKYTFICFLFNAITPSASGGQPVQVYYMKQDGMPVGASSVALLFWTIIYKVALIIIEAVIFLFHHDFVRYYLGRYYWLFWLGITVNLVSILLYSIVVFSKNGAAVLAHGGAWLCHKLRIIRKKERFMKRVDHALEVYQEGAVYMRTHWEVFFLVLFVTIIQRLCFFAITWFIFLALGQHGHSFWDILMIQSFVAVCIDILPSPGGVGVNEGFFVTIFRKVIARRKAVSAMFLSRGVSFYFLLVLSAFVTMIAQIRLVRRNLRSVKGEK